MRTDEPPILARIRSEGAGAAVEEPTRAAPDAEAVVRLVGEAAKADEPERALALWDEAGTRHDPEALDVALQRLTGAGWVPFVGGFVRRKLRDVARVVLRTTTRAGTVELAAAVLGAAGNEDDTQDLETLAGHPAFTLHAATALSNLAHWRGRASLLRLLSTTHGPSRVLVIDRLLPHVREPAVRLALVRDALKGLASEHAAEVAADIAALCDVQSCLDDPRAPEDLKAGARAVLEHAVGRP